MIAPRFYDIHAHCNFKAFANDGEAVVRRSLEAGVWMNLVGSQIDTSTSAVAMAEGFDDGVYATVGLHPVHLVETTIDEEEDHFTTRAEVFDPAAYRALAASKKVVGIGECGLDYYRLAPAMRDGATLNIEAIMALQQEAFRQHIALVKELDLALMLHCRQDAFAGGNGTTAQNAYDDMHRILKEAGVSRGVMHSFCGTVEQARKFTELGLYISISGIVTFKNAGVVRDVVAATPLECLTMDTDSPYLAPDPHRGTRNEPTHIEYIAQKIAEIKGVSVDAVASQTVENARVLFRV